jgi:acyl carrier protein
MLNNLAHELARIVAAVLREPVSADPPALAEQVGQWDSHATVEIIFAVEDRFGFEMTPEQMESVAGIASLVDIVVEALGGARP